MLKLDRAIEIYRKEGLAALLCRSGRYLRILLTSWLFAVPVVDRPALFLSVRRLRRRTRLEQTVDDILETAFTYRGFCSYHDISPGQHPAELAELLDEVNGIRPQSILEIGTDRGGTFYVWTRGTEAETVVSLDINYSTVDHSRLRFRDRREFLSTFSDETDLVMLEGNSHDERTFEEVRDAVDGGIDFLFIDGDHSYKGVKEDFVTYSSLVSSGGIVAIHDINHPHTGVEAFWREIRDEYETKEIHHESEFQELPHIDPERQERFREYLGIGLVYL